MRVRDPQSVRVLADLRRRRGSPHELLVYPSQETWHRIHAADVNNTLRCWGDGPYPAKEFRTWAATVLAAVARSSYIDPRLITLFEDDVVIDLPDAPSQPAVPIRIDGDEVVGLSPISEVDK